CTFIYRSFVEFLQCLVMFYICFFFFFFQAEDGIRDDLVTGVQTCALPISARGDIEYTYEIVPTGFTEDKWVQMSEIRPSSRQHVHHAVVYIRPPDSQWLRNAPVGLPFTASSLSDPNLQHDAHWTDSDMLLVYAPGSSPDQWPDGMAKFIPAGSDLVDRKSVV